MVPRILRTNILNKKRKNAKELFQFQNQILRGKLKDNHRFLLNIKNGQTDFYPTSAIKENSPKQNNESTMFFENYDYETPVGKCLDLATRYNKLFD